MSFFEDASLVLIPSGYKASKVYSVKPTDGTGDLTFTRSLDTATRVGPDGLIEKVRTNLAIQSNGFDTASWSKGEGTFTAGQLDPDGGSTAFLFQATTAGFPNFNQTYSASARTTSIFAKAGTRSSFSILNNTFGNGAEFNLATATATAFGVGSLAKIEAVGNGYFRCSVFLSTSTSSQFILTDIAGSGSVITDNMFFAFAQSETGDIATPYIPTTTAAVSVGMLANVPRLDYTGGGCPKLLLEPQRSNAQTFSEVFSQAKYSKIQSTISSNVTATLDPAGFNGSDKLVEAVSVAEQHYMFFTAQTGANQETQISIFAKAAGRTEFLIWESAITNAQARFNLSTGTIVGTSSGNAANLVTTTPTITEYENGWYRCTLNYKTASGGGTIRVQLYNGNTSYNGNGTDGIFLYGLQEEVNTAYATSYIPTLGAAVTRSADAASKTGISALIGDSEGWIYGEVQGLTNAYGAVSTILSVSDGTSSNRVQFSFNAATNIVTPRIFRAGSTIFVSDVVFNASNTFKFAIQYSGSTAVCFINGAIVATTSGLTFFSAGTLSKVAFDDGTGSALGHAKVSQVLIGQTALTNAQLAELTA